MTMVISGMVAMMAVSFNWSIQTQVDMARDEFKNLRSELSATSGFNYARRMLILDPAWEGTEGAAMPLGGSQTMRITRMDEVPAFPYETPTVARVRIEGLDGDRSLYRLEASFDLNPGDILFNKALAVFGGDVDIHDTIITGDIIAADKYGTAFDFLPGQNGAPDSWVPYDKTKSKKGKKGSPPEDPGGPVIPDPDELYWETYFYDGHFLNVGKDKKHLHRMAIDGTVFRYTENDLVRTGGKKDPTGDPDIQEALAGRPIKTPKIDLSVYLIPGPDRVIFTDVDELENVTMDETAVFHFTGTGKKAKDFKLKLKNVEIRGGIVVYAPNAFQMAGGDQRKHKAGKIELSGLVILGGGPAGIDSVGIIAPFTELKKGKGSKSNSLRVRGLTYVRKMEKIEWAEFKGQVFIQDKIKKVKWLRIIYDPMVAWNPPPGISFANGQPSADPVLVGESFEGVDVADQGQAATPLP